MQCFNQITARIEEKRPQWIRVSDLIWDTAESLYQEYKSSELLIKELKDAGFTVEKGK